MKKHNLILAPLNEDGGGGGGSFAGIEGPQLGGDVTGESHVNTDNFAIPPSGYPSATPAQNRTSAPAGRQQQVPSRTPQQVPDQQQPTAPDPSQTSIPLSALQQLLPMLQQRQAPQQQSSQQESREFSPEEINQILGFPEIGAAAELAQALGVEDAGAAHTFLNKFAQNIVQHMYKTMGVFQDILNENLSGQLAPFREQQATAQRAGFRSNVVSYFPGFAGQEQVLDMVMDQMTAQGYVPQSEMQAYQDVTARAMQLIRMFNPQFDPRQPQQQQLQTQPVHQTPGGRPQMASSFMQPGQGGGGGGSQHTSQWKKAFQR